VTAIGRGRAPVAGETGSTPLVLDVLRLADEEARRVGSPVSGPEHLLAGLLGVRSGIASDVLERLGVDVDALHRRASRREA
jgi:ATP-dependent Clp protease ATP-binding subunit ClpA